MKVKVFIATHKPFEQIQSEIIQPIHAGRDVWFEEAKDFNKTVYDFCFHC